MTGSINLSQLGISQFGNVDTIASILGNVNATVNQTNFAANGNASALALLNGVNNANVVQTSIASGNVTQIASINAGYSGPPHIDNKGTLDPKGGTICFNQIPEAVTVNGVTRPIKDKKTLDKLNKDLAAGKKVTVTYYLPNKVNTGKRHIQITFTPQKNPDGSIKRDICGNICCSYTCGKPYSPLILDLNGDGIKASNDNKSFDIDADGQADQISKMGSDDVMLVADMDGDGKIGEDASEAFGEYTTAKAGDKKGQANYKNGFEALKAFAEAKLGKSAVADGKLDAKEIALLENKFGLRVMDNNGNKTKLSDKGITELSLGYSDDKETIDDRGNIYGETGSFVRNGKKRDITDVYYVKQ